MVTAMVRLKSLKISFLIAIMISCFSSGSIVSLGLAQDSTKYRISGYILDTNGHGIAGAEIIFNVPDIVPSVYSDSSGHYLISAPAGTYHVTVWPPFDSNYVFYDQPALAVSSDVAKNFTLTSGYKVSGYIHDSSGKPVKDGIVLLDYYLSGWFSKDTGYYFVTAPAGTYKLTAAPRSGYSHFLSYSESNFTVNGNIVKNITVNLPSPMPSPSFKISGYILDVSGRGIGGANIIFNVPDIVPSVYSNSSGYYAIYAPAGTYHVNVWPPFDSNYIDYDGPGLVVVSDMTKNITMYSGYKVSGYISDTSGKPVVGAAVLFNNYGSGWFSNSAGYYFLSAPAGTYTINAHPRTGYNYSGPTTDFPTYYEYNFTVNSNTAKNITVGGKSQASSPTISPTSSSSNPSTLPSSMPSTNVIPTQASNLAKPSSSGFSSIINDNGTNQAPIRQTLNTETNPQNLDVSYWTWIAIVAIVAVPIISFAVLLKSNKKTQNT